MVNILVYNSTAEEIEKLADANDTSVAEIVDTLLDYMEDMINENGLIEAH